MARNPLLDNTDDRLVYTVIAFAPDPREWSAYYDGGTGADSFSHRVIGWLTVENAHGERGVVAAILGTGGQPIPAAIARPKGWAMSILGGYMPTPPGPWERP